MPRYKRWHFTINDDAAHHPPLDLDKIAYCIYQKEQCPTTGKHHWQGYVVTKVAVGLLGCKEVLGSGGAHVGNCDGTHEENIIYCTKERTRLDGPFEFGDRNAIESGKPGKRTDLAIISERAKHRGGVEAIAIEYPEYYVRYHRGLHALRGWFLGQRNPETTPDVRVHFGPSGAGKTRAVYDERGDRQIYQKDGSKWWDGYDGQEIVLLDDFAGSDDIPPTELLKILDRYPHRVQTKGGYVVLAPAIFIITTMVSHQEWYRGKEEWLKQLIPFERRVTTWRKFAEGGRSVEGTTCAEAEAAGFLADDSDPAWIGG